MEAINGQDLLYMIQNGARLLASDVERINALNVFPIPDGDTGTNMKMTIDGANNIASLKEVNIGDISKAIARAMVLSARGNSGVILSQFFKGLSLELENKDKVNVFDFAKAMKRGTEKSYSVVSKPTEGTMLTVMREAGEKSFLEIDENTSFLDYFNIYLKYAKEALDKTPELLPVLKEAGVIDSGGAGFILIIEGMLKFLQGEMCDADANTLNNKTNINGFNRKSELTFGYCTEFVLQLTESKVDPDNFDLDIITNFLNSIGNSVVSFKDDDLVKAHVHTFDPGMVLSECRKYGEFLTIKIENMNVQHSDLDKPLEKEHKKNAIVAVSNGSGLDYTFKALGVDEIVSGGQTMNASTSDFIEAFRKIDADNIFVFPNNSNIIMAANMAREAYDLANVIVIPSKTISEGYSAISMLDTESYDTEAMIKESIELIASVNTLEVTYSIRDSFINGININEGDYICIYNNDLIAADKDLTLAVKKAFNAISDFKDMQITTIIKGKDVSSEEVATVVSFVENINPFMEVNQIDGEQQIYSFIIGIE